MTLKSITTLEDVTEVKIVYIYVNTSNEIENVTSSHWTFSQPNMILKTEIIEILKTYVTNKEINMNTYTISSILQYNVDLPAVAPLDDENELIDEFVNYPVVDIANAPFFSVIKQIRDIYWKPTLPIFKELNELTIVFYANKDIKYTNSNVKKTKKIYFRSNSEFQRKRNTFKNQPREVGHLFGSTYPLPKVE